MEQTDTKAHRMEAFIRIALGLLGFGMAGAGMYAVFSPDLNVAGSVALLGFGSTFVLIAGLLDRLETLRYGDLELVLRRKAQEAADQGDLETAAVLDRAADTVSQRVAKLAHSYRSVRSKKPAGAERTKEMTKIIEEAKYKAHASDINQEDVLCRLWTGSEGARVWALGVLQQRPELATTRTVLEALERPDEMFDQYHALVLADAFVRLSSTRPWARERVVQAISRILASGALGTDKDCLKLANSITEYVPSEPSS